MPFLSDGAPLFEGRRLAGGGGGVGFLVVVLAVLTLVWGVSCVLLVFFYRRRKIHPSDPGSGTIVRCYDSATIRTVQEFFDQTFRDRPYKGIYTPKQLKVVECYRVENDSAWTNYRAFKDKLREKRGDCPHVSDEVITANAPLDLGGQLDPEINECRFFHGTQPGSANAIACSDFRLPATHEHGGLYGKGVYLAESSTKAHMYCRSGRKRCCRRELKPILIARAALGIIKETTEATPNVASLENGASKGLYDSVCGDRRKLQNHWAGYREFIVYDPAQAVTEYLVWVSEK